MAKPRYRTNDQMTYLNGCPYRAGSEVDFIGWPLADLNLAPVNDEARAVVAYFNKHSREPFLPSSPMAAGQIYLPGSLPGLRNAQGHPVALKESDTPAGAPRYKRNWGASICGTRFEAGEVFGCLDWPVFGFDPVNDAARRVVAYHEAHAAHVDLPHSPWNTFDNSLWFPDLAPQLRPALRHTVSQVELARL